MFTLSKIPHLLGLLLAVSFSVQVAARPLVVTSIRPLALIAQELGGEQVEVRQLLPASVSPHLYQLKPSDRLLLERADRVFWVGADLERFLTKPLEQLEPGVVLELIGLPGIAQIEADHGGHDHEGRDPHIWLNPDNARVMAQRLSEEFVVIDPDNRDIYQRNLRTFLHNLARFDSEFSPELRSLAGRGYLLLHDGYAHYEERFGLRRVGALSLSPDRKPGARHLLALRRMLDRGDVVCVFREPQYEPAIIGSLLRGHDDVTVGVLDPLGMDASGYSDFMVQFTASFVGCLKESSI